jgi:hypothetical protein
MNIAMVIIKSVSATTSLIGVIQLMTINEQYFLKRLQSVNLWHKEIGVREYEANISLKTLLLLTDRVTN